MKKSLLGLLIPLFLLAACTPKNQFSIQGTLDDVKDSTMVFLKLRGEKSFENIDSCLVVNKTFTLKGQIDQIQVVYLAIPELKFNQPIFVEPSSKISLTGSLMDFNVSGSVIHVDYVEYENSLSEIQTKQQDLYNQYVQTPREDTATLNSIETEYEVLDSMLNQTRAEWIQSHSDSYVTPYVIMTELIYSASADELQNYYSAFSEPIQSSYYGVEMKKRIETLSAVAEGQPAPEIALPDQNGDTLRLSDLKGQYVLIDFWASWCRPCRQENPVVVAAYEKYHDKGFTVYGISLDNDRDKWLKAIIADRLVWNTHVSVLKGWDNESAKKYGVMSIPANFLIDKDGIIIGHDLRGENLEAKLNEIFPAEL